MKQGFAACVLAAMPSVYADAAVGPDTPLNWNIPRSTLREATAAFNRRIGSTVDAPLPDFACAEALVGPLRGRMTPSEAAKRLFAPVCIATSVQMRSDGTLVLRSVSERGPPTIYYYSVPRMTRMQAFHALSKQSDGLLLAYLSSDEAEENALVGPIEGPHTIEEALRIAMAGTELTLRWIEPEMVSVERPAFNRERTDACHSCAPIVVPPPSAKVLVTDSRLPALEVMAPVNVIDRARIEATGASHLGDVLRYVTQAPYMRGRGFYASGAQFAELRGLGAPYTLILINGRRADGSAADLATGAFDLNSVPLAAVERLEISTQAPSVVAGTDAIGGTVNIVLRERAGLPEADIRYATADGGARERIASVIAGTTGANRHRTLILEYSEAGALLGENRSRWRDQDFTRYGGMDQRSFAAAPANVRTVDGAPLPGLSSSSAGVVASETGAALLQPARNRTSPLATQAIVPQVTRASAIVTLATPMGSGELHGEAMLTHRDTHFQLAAESVSDLMMPADHPANPVGVPLAIDVAFTGLRSPSLDVTSQAMRAVLGATGPMGRWHYDVHAREAQEIADVWMTHLIDARRISEDVASGEDLAVFSERPGQGVSEQIFLPPTRERYASGGSQLSAVMRGPLFDVASATVGVEHRLERVLFSAVAGRAQRDVASAFARLELPLRSDLDVSLGSRWDRYSDITTVLRSQMEMRWRAGQPIELVGAYAQSFHAPSLIDLHSPRLFLPTQLYDPRRNESATVQIATGGNPDLQPTTGRTSSFSILYGGGSGQRASLTCWSITMQRRVSSALPQTLLANEQQAIAGRVIRANPTQDDVAAGRPGRLLAIDISRANFGDTQTRGIDAAVSQTFDTQWGLFQPRLDLTYTDAFAYSNLPIDGAPMHGRVGIASEWGTIPRWSGVLSLHYARAAWSANVLGRLRSGYADYAPALEVRSGDRIGAGALCDLNVTWEMHPQLTLTLGATNVLDTAPSFSRVNGPTGFDASQGDLTGRVAFIKFRGSF